MISARVFRAGEELADIAVEDLSQIRSEPATLVWVDVTGGTDEEIDRIGEEFSIHPLALEDCRHQHQRPKVDQYRQHILLVAYGTEAAIQGEPTRLHELDLVAGENFLVSFHQVPPIDAQAVAKRIEAHPELAHHGAGFLLYVVLDELVDSFAPTMDLIGERVEDLGEDVFAGRQVQSDVFALRRDLVTIRRVVAPMGDAMTVLLRRELGLYDEETRHYLQDVYDHLLRIVQAVEAYQDLAAGALEANLTVVSNKVNEVARTLTAYAAIFAALTLVSGVYGMNFQHMPELHWRLGYPYALGLMLALAAGLWGFFKRKRWL
ncbi:MAG TPA: magnesium/cobalt transporter CorA [Actinomycetes bacterium]